MTPLSVFSGGFLSSSPTLAGASRALLARGLLSSRGLAWALVPWQSRSLGVRLSLSPTIGSHRWLSQLLPKSRPPRQHWGPRIPGTAVIPASFEE